LSILESIEVKSSQEDSSQENVLQSESTPNANYQMGLVKLLPCTQSYMSAKVGAACVKSEVTNELIGPTLQEIWSLATKLLAATPKLPLMVLKKKKKKSLISRSN
jgi:hypothetical protein